MQYEWDEAKAKANVAKHGISFTAAARALEDPGKIEILDDRFGYAEERIRNICMGQRPVGRNRRAGRKRLPHHQRPQGNTT